MSIKELEELLQVYSKHMVDVNTLNELYSQGIPIVVPSTTSLVDKN
jgi:hypothetical protein